MSERPDHRPARCREPAGGGGAADPRQNAEEPGEFRRRLLDGMAAAIGERGFRESTIADVVRHARTSRRTFYEHFASKQDCFIALLQEANAEMVRQIAAAVDPRAPWDTQVRQAIEAWIACAQSQPTLTLSWIREVPALGDDVLAVAARGARGLHRAHPDAHRHRGAARRRHQATAPPVRHHAARRPARAHRHNRRGRRQHRPTSPRWPSKPPWRCSARAADFDMLTRAAAAMNLPAGPPVLPAARVQGG